MATSFPYFTALRTGYVICEIANTSLASEWSCIGEIVLRVERPFTIEPIVILPDHLYAVWTLLKGDADYSGHWRAIKSRFARALRPSEVPLNFDARGEHRL